MPRITLVKSKQHKTRFTKTSKRKAVNHAFSLVRSGTSITKARKLVATGLGINPNTLWQWQNDFEMKTPVVVKTANLVKNNTVRKSTKLVTKSGSDMIKGLEIMKGRLGTVFTSLVDQDGTYTNQDALAISGVANGILNTCKAIIIERKITSTINNTKHLT